MEKDQSVIEDNENSYMNRNEISNTLDKDEDKKSEKFDSCSNYQYIFQTYAYAILRTFN